MTIPIAVNTSWTNSTLLLFHGTTKANADSILKDGINLACCRNTCDFGRGLYTTTHEEQAKNWAKLIAKKKRDQPVVIRYDVDRDDLAKLDFLAFVRGHHTALEFWDFVQHCRLGASHHSRPGTSAWYDVVVGPVVRQWTTNREVYSNYDQFSFHTPAGIQLLTDSNFKVLP